MTVLRHVFANGDMRRVQAGWLLAITAEWIYLVSLLVLAYTLGGVLAVGVVGVIRTLPAAVLGPALATITDRLPRHYVLLGVHAARALAIVVMALSAVAELAAPIVFAFVLLEGIVATLHRATTLAIMPALARSPQELVASNVTISLGEGLGVLVGPAIGGVLVATASPVLGLIAGSIGLGLAAVAVLGVTPAPKATLPAPPMGSRLRELTAGFGALREHPHAGLLVGVLISQTFVRGVLTVLIVAVAVELILIGEGGVGFLNSALGLGGLVGALFAFGLVMRRSLAFPLLISLALWGAPIAAIGLLPAVAVAFGAMAAIGAANAVLDVAAFTLLQRTVPNRVRGRVLGALEGLVALSIGLGSLVAPLLVTLAGLQGALVITGALLPIVAVLGARLVVAAERKAVVPDRELHLLRGVPIFAPLPLTLIEQLAGSVDRLKVEVGIEVVRQGDAGDAFYIIEGGSVEVLHDGMRIAQLGEGDAFGEIALLRDVPRTATVRASAPTEMLRLTREAFIGAICGNAQSLGAADAMVGTRLKALGHD